MEGKVYYIYVLKLTNECFYVGCTINPQDRIKKHFGPGGAIATRECKAYQILEIYSLPDYIFNKNFKKKPLYAHQVAEVLIANEYAELYGYEKVRGAKHGMSWTKTYETHSMIKRVKKISLIEDGFRLKENMEKCNIQDIISMEPIKITSQKGPIIKKFQQ